MRQRSKEEDAINASAPGGVKPPLQTAQAGDQERAEEQEEQSEGEEGASGDVEILK